MSWHWVSQDPIFTWNSLEDGSLGVGLVTSAVEASLVLGWTKA
jgi:hypothetical protein